MSTVTDTDLQQLKDVIIASQTATQKQITDLTLEMRLGFSEVKGEIKELKAEIKGIHTELTDIKSNQKSQDTRFWSLVFLVLAALIGIIGKFVKFY